jgi:hypothetical protein
MYVLRDDFLYSPKISMPQNVLTSGSAWNQYPIQVNDYVEC